MGVLLTVLAVSLCAAILSVFLKDSRLPSLSIIIILAAGAIILIYILPRLGEVVQMFSQIAGRANINKLYLDIILKIIIISYLAEFGAQLCKDAGAGALATKVELTAKVVVMTLGLPIMVAILDTVLQLLP